MTKLKLLPNLYNTGCHFRTEFNQKVGPDFESHNEAIDWADLEGYQVEGS